MQPAWSESSAKPEHLGRKDDGWLVPLVRDEHGRTQKPSKHAVSVSVPKVLGSRAAHEKGRCDWRLVM